MSTPAHTAAALIRHYAYDTDPDKRTSMADSRIALLIASGVDMDDIDPSMGRDYSRSHYEACRRDWIFQVKMHGFSDFYGGGDLLAHVIAYWAESRPSFLAEDDPTAWLAEAEKAHRAYWEQDGHSCSNPHCDFHPSADHAELLRFLAEEDDPETTTSGPGVQDSLFDDLPQPNVTVPRARRRPINDLHLPA
ncbi:hypothetical protein [Actinacidiphila acididurans]|uniref:DUF4274 domain-containing protein n=1 Tax=Actinacidiphila acididurans TaxID=2784346 RepID=A0ABS2U2W7_9ACTN|nr:hypothetical protein [Actinacidiphila acididurans]MBM9509940.1 hypothetical protein [Actinacidiphila acididurans]